MIYSIANNNDIVTLNIPVTNHDALVTATGVTLTQTFPAGISIYGTPIVSKGTYNTGTKIWTIASLLPQETANLQLKVKVDDINLQPFTIKSILAITEPESSLLNNTRFDTLTLGNGSDSECNPCNFVEPVIIINEDIASLSFDVSKNDTINCPCCQKVFEIVGSPVNVNVLSFENGVIKYQFINPTLSGTAEYKVTCTNCSNGMDYTSDPVTITFNPIFSPTYKDYTVKPVQTGDYSQELLFDFFWFDLATSAINFELIESDSWEIGQKITVYAYDSTQSGPLVNLLTVICDGVDVFLEGGNTKVISSNYSSFTIVYLGSAKFAII